MKNKMALTHYVCGCCKQELPEEAFYINKRTQRPDNYCKACRKENSSKHREAERYIAQNENKRHPYPVITEVADPALRRELLRRALQIIAERVKRKRNLRKEQELKEQEPWEG